MKTIPIKKGLFTLLIIEALIISIVTIAFMVNLYHLYTKLIYSESAEVLNLHVFIADSKFSEIENLSFEMLSNRDIQDNLLKYNNSIDSFEAYKTANDLYTQLFTRWIMNKNIVSMSFIFLDGRQVNIGHLQMASLSDSNLKKIINAAASKNGSCGWTVNMAGNNIVTLYRLIKDISGNKFKPLGTLIINVDANYFLSHTPVISQKYQPDIICIADNQILSRNPVNFNFNEIIKFVNSSRPYEIVSLNHEPYFISSKKLAYNNWSLVYMLSSRNLLSSISQMNIIYGFTLIFFVIVIITIGYGFANAITKPITELTQAMKVVEDGEYSVVLNNPTSDSHLLITEVVQLSRGFSQMIQEIDYLINEVFAKQLMIMEMKYKMLQQQINPHFLYNTLDTINWKAVKGGNEEISTMVKSLSKMLRGSIKGPDIITLQEDLSFVESYIKIQKIRFEERLDFSIMIPASIYQASIPRLTLQPIVENCIIHNLEKYSGICKVSLSSSLSDKQLEIYVEDNGRGVNQEYMTKVLNGQVEATNNSIGLRNIDQRIKMAFGEKYGISVENKKPTGTRVIIVLPYKGDFDENTINC